MYFLNTECIDQIKIVITEIIFSVGISILIFLIFYAITKIINFFIKGMRFCVPRFFLVMIFLGVCGLFFNYTITNIYKSDPDITTLQKVIIDLPCIFWFFPLGLYIISLKFKVIYGEYISIFACFACFACLFFLVYHDILFLCKYKI
jgi:hypothetical protein